MKQNRILKGLLNIMMNSSYFSCLDLYFRWHDSKDGEICDPMEKI